MNYLTLSLALVVTLVGTATAPASAQIFAGPYVGAQAGWNQNKIGDVEADIGTAQIAQSRDAATLGIFAGYNVQPTGGVVLSAEGAVNFGLDDDITSSSKDATATINPEYGFDLGLRAGYLVTDKTLVYARGGYENIRVKISMDDNDGPRRDKANLDGWSIGAGIERAIIDRISARLEYRYSDLGSNDNKFERHQVLAGVAWHF